MNEIRIYYDEERAKAFPLTAAGWDKMIAWDEIIGVQNGVALIDGERWEWGDGDYLGPRLVDAIRGAIEVLLCSKSFVDDPQACDDVYSVYDRIPMTLAVRERLGLPAPETFEELVRWASHDV